VERLPASGGVRPDPKFCGTRLGNRRSTASNAALLYLILPVITAVMAVTLLGERMTLVRWGSLLPALLGVMMVSGPDWHHANLDNMNLIILVAITGSAFYKVYSKRPLYAARGLSFRLLGVPSKAVMALGEHQFPPPLRYRCPPSRE
jgi:drug/metabolite transporter (DMT)-like permease